MNALDNRNTCLRRSRSRLVLGLCLAVFSALLLLLLEAHYRQYAPRGYFQSWTSETMMQTVSIEDLRDAPLQSLWYVNIQPPLFDTLRAILAQVWKSADSMAMLLKVDQSLYVIWALVYGAIVFVIYWWLSELTNLAFAAVSTLFFCAHPAMIFYSTLLDTTILSAFLILIFYYFLWRIKKARPVSAIGFAVIFLLMYFTRSIFQWQWLLILALVLLLLKFPKRKLITFLAITGVVIGLYTVKQVSLFDLSGTSAFSGLNLCHSIGCKGANEAYEKAALQLQQQAIPVGLPNVLTRVTKIDGSVNLNNPYFLSVNRSLEEQYRTQLLAMLHSPGQLLQNYLINLRVYLAPSSHYISDNLIVNRLPWRAVYDFIFSAPVLPLLLISAFIFWAFQAHKNGFWRTLGFCLPALLVILLCIMCDRGENMRFKFFIEPVLFVFIASQAYAAGKNCWEALKKRGIV